MRRSRCKRNQTQAGGGAGGGWGFSSTPMPEINNPLSVAPIGNCRAVDPSMRPGFLIGGVPMRGLPGMSGGRRKGRKGRKANKTRKSRIQSGGRYGFDASASPVGGTPWGSSYAGVSPIPCEASRSAVPPSGAAGEINVRPTNAWGPQSGGAVLTGAPLDHGPTSSSPFIEVPRASYEVSVSNPIQTAAGTLLSINVPKNPSEMNSACLKTGGGRKGSKSRKSRKSRKARKSRKGRKH